jgi:group II intron reverse transcriptase/maturase
MQDIYDDLYVRSKQNETFDNLMELIVSERNVMLAYRNIKSNAGSNTPGTDECTIQDIARLTPVEVTTEVRQRLRGKKGYHPGMVRRKEIPKPHNPNVTRPIGIACIWDRLIQQCIKQVIEPICEAKFYEHSYGFRPNRSVEHAMAMVGKHLQISNLHYVIEFDIKEFFDNVNHSKLIKQMWTLGIQDKELIYVLKQILKTPVKLENGQVVTPERGTPQGGILSPLLANIVLNELDWWIASQWENNPVISHYKVQTNRNGTPNKGNAYHEMRKTNLKEMHIVRYADDLRIFCRTRSEANRVLIATTKWVQKRLKLQVSEEKTRIVNTKKKRTKFLGFELKVRQRGKPSLTQKQKSQYETKSLQKIVNQWKAEHPEGMQKQCAQELGINPGTVNKWWNYQEPKPQHTMKYVLESHISDENCKKIRTKLKKQIRRIKYPKHSSEQYEINKYNAQVLGIHNYFAIATMVSVDLKPVRDSIYRSLKNAMKTPRGSRITTNGKLTGIGKRYADSKDTRFSKRTGKPIYPIGAIQHRSPKCKNRKINSYTPEGRQLIHKDLTIDMRLLHAMLINPIVDESTEYNDNRLALFSAQYGKCAVTGYTFETPEDIHCHHKIPKECGGNDNYRNLILINKMVHTLIHAKTEEAIQRYLKILSLDAEALNKVNELRKLAGYEAIEKRNS